MFTVRRVDLIYSAERQNKDDFRMLTEMGVEAHRFVLEEEVVGDQRIRMN